MKRKLLILFLAITSVFACAFALSACDKDSGGGSINGTYYLFDDGEYDKYDFIVLDSGEWRDSEKMSGSYKTSDGKIIFYVEMFGETEEWDDGTISDGVITIVGIDGKQYYCKEGKVPNNSSSSSHKHSYKKSVTAPTCTEQGYTLNQCSCGDSYIDNYTYALGHKFENYVSNGDVTCTEDGTKSAVCSRKGCNKTYTVVESALGHKFENYVSNGGATCAKNSTETATCIRCTQTDTREIKGTALGHKFSDGVCEVCKQPEPSDGLKYTLNSSGTYTATGIGTCKDTDIIIADLYDGLPVTYIGGSAFNRCSSLTSVTIPDSVTSIGSDAFKECWELKSVTIGSGVTSIGHSAFYECWDLIKVSIPDSVTKIDNYAFYKCTSLKSVTIGNGVTSIGIYVFKYCNYLENITVGENNTAYSSHDGILYNKDKTKFLHIPMAIKGSIAIPNGITSISDWEFPNCNSLKSVTIPDSVTSIKDSFYYCNYLESITVSKNNTVYSSQDGILYNKDKTEFIYIPKAINGSVTIPDGITEIGSDAFEDCSSLASITIPDSVTSIGNDAFFKCNGLREVHITDIAAWCSISFDDYYSNPLNYAHNLYLNSQLVKNIIIPDGVTSIGSCAFVECWSLNKVTIPDSVTKIGGFAFSGCRNLTNIKFEGTKAQWKAVEKGSWEDTGDYTVHCSDGDI